MSENVDIDPSGESTDSPAENSTDVVVEGPTKPFARIKGRIVLPDGKPVKSGVVVFDPIPDRVHVTLPDGSSMIGSRVRIELDKDGRITSDENPYLDIVGCDTDGVTPAGVWNYLIRISTGGITRRAVKSLKAGSSYDLSDLLSGKEEESSSMAYEWLARLIDERLKTFTEKLGAEKARLDELTENAITYEYLDSGLYGSFPHVERDRDKPAEQYGVSRVGQAFGVMARTMIAVDKDLHAVKNGPYKVAGLSANGGYVEPVDRDLAGTMTHISGTIRDMGGVIHNVTTDEVNKALYGSEETGDRGPITVHSEAIASIETRLKAVEDAGESVPTNDPEFKSRVVIAEKDSDDATEAQLYFKGYEQGWRIGMDYMNNDGLSICLNELNGGFFKDAPHVVFQKNQGELVTAFPYGNVRIGRPPVSDFDATRKSYVDSYVDSLDKKLETKLAALETKLAALETKLAALEASLSRE